jgi:hypothetical protein
VSRVAGPEAPPLHQDRLPVKDLRRLHHLAGGGKHGGVGEALFDQLQAQQAVVDPREGGTRDLHHVDLDVLASQPVQQRPQQGRRISTMIERTVGQVDSQHAEALLLGDGGVVEQVYVHDDL